MAESRIISNLSRTATKDNVGSASYLAIETTGETYKIPMAVLSPTVLRELFDNYHLRLAAQDISTTDKEFDFTVHESGVGLKLAGFKITCPVTGGDGTAKGYFTTGLSFVDKHGNDLGASTFYLYGTGSVTFEFDPDNTRWILVEDNRQKLMCYYHTKVAAQLMKFNTKGYDPYNAVTTGDAWKFTAPFNGEFMFNVGGAYTSGGVIYLYLEGVQTHAMFGVNNSFNSGTIQMRLNKDQYVDFRSIPSGNADNAVFAYFKAHEVARL